jgi:hypothetical protein
MKQEIPGFNGFAIPANSIEKSNKKVRIFGKVLIDDESRDR